MTNEDPQSLPQRVATGFQKVAMVMRQEAWKAASGRGLTPTQAQIVSTLANADGSMGLGQLATELALTPGTVSEAVRVLVEKDLVEKSRRDDDRRAVEICLTRKGKRDAGNDSGALTTIVDAARSMNHDQQAGIIVGLVATIRSLQEQGHIPVARMCVGCKFFRPNVHSRGKPHHCDYVDAPIANEDLRFDCGEFEAADPKDSKRVWAAFCEQPHG